MLALASFCGSFQVELIELNFIELGKKLKELYRTSWKEIHRIVREVEDE